MSRLSEFYKCAVALNHVLVDLGFCEEIKDKIIDMMSEEYEHLSLRYRPDSKEESQIITRGEWLTNTRFLSGECSNDKVKESELEILSMVQQLNRILKLKVS